MNWEIIVHKSVGPIEFGMNRSQSREVLSTFQEHREDGKLTEVAMPSDLYDAFEVRFSKYDRCAAVSLTAAVNVTFKDQSLFELEWAQLTALVTSNDKEAQVSEDQVLSHALGIRVKKDGKGSRVSEILCFEADYFYLYKEIPLPTVASSFYLQVGFVEDVDLTDQQFETLQEGAKAIFANTREKGVLLWNNLPVPFDYQADVPEVLLKMTPILREMYWAEKGDELFSIQSKNLDFGWRIVWEDDVVNIDSDWRKIPGNLQDAANEGIFKKVYTSKTEFLSEWKILIIQFERAVSATNSSFIDVDAQEMILELPNLTKNIQKTGKFYQNETSDLVKSIKNRNASLQLLVATAGILVISFGIYWLVTKDSYYPFQWIKNNWIALSIGVLAVIIIPSILSFFIRKKSLK